MLGVPYSEYSSLRHGSSQVEDTAHRSLMGRSWYLNDLAAALIVYLISLT